MQLFILFLLISSSLSFKYLPSTKLSKFYSKSLTNYNKILSLKDDQNSNNQISDETYGYDQKIEGYINMDLSKDDDGKQSRVVLYIIFAILPCLLLVPFMMSRDFVPQGGF